MGSSALVILRGMVGFTLTLSSYSLLFAQSASEPGKQSAEAILTGDGTKVQYLAYLPTTYNAAGAEAHPLILFLHGRGERGEDIELVKKWGPPLMAGRGDELPFIIISPQCPADDCWSSPLQLSNLTELLNQVEQRYRVDLDRVYLTGLSMGGAGSWALATQSPERFAAVIPICGAADVNQAQRLKDIPIWVFHGDQDDVIPISDSNEMVDALRAAGSSKVRYTTLEHFGHNSWSAAYETPELYQWLLEQKRQKPGTSSQSSN